MTSSLYLALFTTISVAGLILTGMLLSPVTNLSIQNEEEDFLEPIQKIFEKIEKKLSDEEIFQNLHDKIENSIF